MRQNKFTWVVSAVIGLAAFGIISQVFTNPANLLKTIIIILIIGLLVFATIKFFFRNKTTSSQMKKYKMAVKQSKLKYNNNHSNRKSTTSSTKRKLNKRASHLRVIEGTKPKEKSRTIF